MDDTILNSLKDKMQKAIEIVQTDMQTIRSGRATPSLVENIGILVYGGQQKMKIKELATITTSDLRMIVIAPFDPSIVEEVVKGIQEANVGYNPVSEGKIIRISIPPLTEERRDEYKKLAKAKAEGGRIMIRQIRHDSMVQLKRTLEASDIDQDLKKRLEKRVQESTDQFVSEIDALLKHKEEELERL